MSQISWFGPVPKSYIDLISDENDVNWNFLGEATHRIQCDNLWKPFHVAQDITEEDKNFICKIMKLDPRERPTAAELLQDEWFHGT